MLALALLGTLTALAADPCARLEADADGVRTARVEAPTAFDPVGDLLALQVVTTRPTRLSLAFRLPGDHAVVRLDQRGLELELDGGDVVALAPDPGAPLAVELRSALAPGLVMVDVPVDVALSPEALGRLAAAKVVTVRLTVDPGHAWRLKGSASARLRSAFACAARLTQAPAGLPPR